MRRTALLLASALCVHAVPDPGVISAEDLFRTRPFSHVKISPDGRHLGAIASDEADVRRFIETRKDLLGPDSDRRIAYLWGDPDTDRRDLADASPINHIAQIRVPVLIAHGTDDEMVDVAQSKALARELRKRGVPTETFYRSNEGHGFSKLRDQVDFYHRVEAFLAKYLGGASLTPAG
jgi:acetyl esterase/lipase